VVEQAATTPNPSSCGGGESFSERAAMPVRWRAPRNYENAPSASSFKMECGSEAAAFLPEFQGGSFAAAVQNPGFIPAIKTFDLTLGHSVRHTELCGTKGAVSPGGHAPTRPGVVRLTFQVAC